MEIYVQLVMQQWGCYLFMYLHIYLFIFVVVRKRCSHESGNPEMFLQSLLGSFTFFLCNCLRTASQTKSLGGDYPSSKDTSPPDDFSRDSPQPQKAQIWAVTLSFGGFLTAAFQ